jgi:uncharacterized coiled-coil protein SlyX
MTITNTGLIGIGTSSPDRELDVEGNVVASNLALRSKLSIGDSVLCYFDLETSRNISGCGSSIRYKENINRFTSGLSLITRLRPVTFNWKSSGKLDVGLVAEEVEAVEPLLVTYNATGGVEGVKYERLGVVLLNAVQEQQQQLRAKDARIAELETRLARYEARLASLEMSVRQTETIARRDEAPAAALKSRP